MRISPNSQRPVQFETETNLLDFEVRRSKVKVIAIPVHFSGPAIPVDGTPSTTIKFLLAFTLMFVNARSVEEYSTGSKILNLSFF